jgi:integrase
MIHAARENDPSRFKFPPQPHYTVHQMFCDYSRERLIAKGKDPVKAWGGFNRFMRADLVPPYQAAEKITTGQIEDFIDARMATGLSIITVIRELTFVKAAVRNAHRRNRIAVLPYIEIPEGEAKHRRPLTEEEYRLVMSKPMSARLRRFYIVAYYTGHRSRAIEEVKWRQIDFGRRLINFNVPGRIITNKRRCAEFPIPDEFLARLVSWKARAKDDYVIGLSPTGKVVSTYNEAAYVVRELCGLTDPSLVPRHCIRKMFATELVDRMIEENGEADLETVGFLMADDPGTVRKNYLVNKPQTVRNAANLRARALK